MAKGSEIYFISRSQHKLTKGFVGVIILCEDVGGYRVVIPQVGDGSSGSAIGNFRFGSRIDWRNKCNTR